jgi:exopolyphosphatase / guanosine-5'-triphosphate,3'-diphosphate pyrophosphatase
MTDDTRLRDGVGLRGDDGQGPHGGPRGSATAGAAEMSAAVRPPAAGTSVYAALDLGTNNCRLLIACPTPDGFRVVDSFSRIIRLGEGISATGYISDAAIDRAIAALSICRDKIRSRKAKRLRLIATEACRAALNADGFRDRVAAETGIRLEVIDRETEAALAVVGCSPLVDPEGRGAILFDIGGGSTELVRIERDPGGQGAASRTKAWMSMPLGVVTLAEHFGGRDVTPQSYASMVQEVARHVAPFAAEHGGALRDMHLLGTSGTVTTLAGIHLNLVRYDRRRIDGVWMSDAEISATIGRLLGMSFQERAGNHCISLERADLVLAGCAILDAIRQAFPLPRLRVADRGLREGMLVEMMREDGALGRVRQA